jgi:uncharacterized protein
MWEQPIVQALTGDRLHFQHGPIDLVLKAWGGEEAVAVAYAAAKQRFGTVLGELVDELVELRKPMDDDPSVSSPVAKRMVAACRPFADVFVTPMAAVAGAVADEMLATMLAAAPLIKAFVNDGGDIAIHVGAREAISIGMATDFSRGPVPAMSGKIMLSAKDRIGGIATSGRHGRSLSLGIADSVTALARDAATADVAATLIGNAVNVESPAIIRRPARDIDPDSDLGTRAITVDVGPLAPSEIDAAIVSGRMRTERYLQRGLIAGAAMRLGERNEVIGGALHRIAEEVS